MRFPVCGYSSPFDAQTMDDYYVFSWQKDEWPFGYGFNYIDYLADNIFKYSQNTGVALGDVFKNSEGKV